jgi:8-oxo-dGTP pyrophosphatase MutT (NUDIX family)
MAPPDPDPAETPPPGAAEPVGPDGIRLRDHEPGQAYEPGRVVAPRDAATVIVLRDGPGGPEVLLVQRDLSARFMAGAWVFPGGAVDPEDGTGDRAALVAGARELREETGVELADPDELVAFSRWITPSGARRRFDTRFFVVRLPDGAEPHVDGSECVDLRWSRPDDALAEWRAGDLLIVFPTVKHLEQLVGFADVDALLRHARGREVPVVLPRFVVEGAETRVVLPGEPGYDDAPEAESDGA